MCIARQLAVFLIQVNDLHSIGVRDGVVFDVEIDDETPSESEGIPPS